MSRADTRQKSMSVMAYVARNACFPPLVLLGVDRNMNGRYEADDYAWQWEPEPAKLHGDTFLQCEPTAPQEPDPGFVLVDVRDTYFCYGPNLAGTTYGLTYAPLPAYQVGLGTLDGITPMSRVLALKVHVGGSPNWASFSGLVDRVTMAGATWIDDPRDSRSHFEVVTSR